VTSLALLQDFWFKENRIPGRPPDLRDLCVSDDFKYPADTRGIHTASLRPYQSYLELHKFRECAQGP